MKSLIVFAAGIFLACCGGALLAQADGGADSDAAKRLVEHRLDAQPSDVDTQMTIWKAEVLKEVLAEWMRPSAAADAAKWVMRVRVDEQGRLLNLSWVTRTGNRKLDRSIVNAFEVAHPYPAPPDASLARLGVDFTDEATALLKTEAKLAANAARNAAALAEIQSAGPLRAYLALVSFRYRKCERIANEWLKTPSIAFAGLTEIEACVTEEEAALTDEARLALKVAPDGVSEAIKNLHAYTIASLRALTNFDQSAIEHRQARAERATGIDERATRISLEL